MDLNLFRIPLLYRFRAYCAAEAPDPSYIVFLAARDEDSGDGDGDGDGDGVQNAVRSEIRCGALCPRTHQTLSMYFIIDPLRLISLFVLPLVSPCCCVCEPRSPPPGRLQSTDPGKLAVLFWNLLHQTKADILHNYCKVCSIHACYNRHSNPTLVAYRIPGET